MTICVNDDVLYVAYGTPGGEYPAGIDRAAKITQINNHATGDVGLCVINPTGLFFKESILRDDSPNPKPGTWHYRR